MTRQITGSCLGASVLLRRSGIQNLLKGRELVPVLCGCPKLDGPFQKNGQGCWFVRLKSKTPKSKQHDTGTGACESEKRAEQQRVVVGRTAASLCVPPVKIVHVGVGEKQPLGYHASSERNATTTSGQLIGALLVTGFAVLSKPAGISTEDLVSGLTAQVNLMHSMCLAALAKSHCFNSLLKELRSAICTVETHRMHT